MIKKIFWRLALLYVLFYIFPHKLEYHSGYDPHALTLWDGITTWFGKTFFDWEFTTGQFYRGYDSKYELSRYMVISILACIGTMIWLFIDSYLKKEYTQKLKVLVRTVVRYHVGFILISFGLAKIFMLQFGTIGIEQLEKTIGETTAMGFMWIFMSYSKVYVMAAGWIEFIGGILLLFRKTTFLGALILLGAMANVVLMDIGYDVSVTLFAIQLFLLIMLLLTDRFKNLYDFFIVNKTTTPQIYFPLFGTPRYRKAGMILKALLLLTIFFFNLNDTRDRIANEIHNRYAWLTSFHDVETFVRNGDSIPKTTKEETRWKSITFNGLSYFPESLQIVQQNNSRTRYKFEMDTISESLRIKPYFDEEATWQNLRLEKVTEKEYLFKGIINGDTIYAKTKVKKPEDYLLIAYKNRFLIN